MKSIPKTYKEVIVLSRSTSITFLIAIICLMITHPSSAHSLNKTGGPEINIWRGDFKSSRTGEVQNLNFSSLHYEYLKSNNSLSLKSKREIVGVTDASASVISGTGIASSINAKTAYSVTVTAKDSSGNNIGHGGDTFLIQIANHCTLSVEFM